MIILYILIGFLISWLIGVLLAFLMFFVYNRVSFSQAKYDLATSIKISLQGTWVIFFTLVFKLIYDFFKKIDFLEKVDNILVNT